MTTGDTTPDETESTDDLEPTENRESTDEAQAPDAEERPPETDRPEGPPEPGLDFETFSRRGVLGVLAALGLLAGSDTAAAASGDHLGEQWTGTPSTDYGLQVKPTTTTGLFGYSALTSGTAYGVRGETDSGDGYGLYTSGDAKVDGTIETADVQNSGTVTTTNVDANLVKARNFYDPERLRLQINGNNGQISLTKGSNGTNVYNGTDVNNIPLDISGSTISGGGYDDGSTVKSNKVYSDFGTVGGGAGNHVGTSGTSSTYATVAGGENNDVSGDHATIGGGESNTIGSSGNNSASSVIAGGWDNQTYNTGGVVGGGYGNMAGSSNNSGTYNTVGGGRYNEATGGDAVVAGGYSNSASGYNATIPGGSANTASGDYSFAAGSDATASHDYSFVWNDYTSGFGSTASNQFLVSASNGIGLGTDSPATPVDVAGDNNWDLDSGDGDLRIGDDSYRLGIGVALGGVGAGTARLRAKGGTGKLVLGGNQSDVMAVQAGSTDSVYPLADNTYSLGKSGNRWSSVWAADGYINTSDARLKSDVSTVESGVETVEQLDPVSFQWSDAIGGDVEDEAGDASEAEDLDDGDDEPADQHFGFLAQDVAEVLPEAVEEPEEGYLGLKYNEIVPVLTRAVQEQQETLDEKDDRIETLEDDLAEKEARIDDLERRLERLERQAAE